MKKTSFHFRSLFVLLLSSAGCSQSSTSEVGVDAATYLDATDFKDLGIADVQPSDAGSIDAPIDGGDMIEDAGQPDGASPDAGPTTFAAAVINTIFGGAHGLALAPDGRLFVSDTFANRSAQRQVYVLEPPYLGQPVSTGITLSQPAGLLWDNGQLLVCDVQGGGVHVYAGTPLSLVETIDADQPWNVSRAPGGDLLSISFLGRLQRLRAGQPAETLIENLNNPFDLVPLEDGTVWISEQGPTAPAVRRFDRAGTPLETVGHPWNISEGLARATDGALWVADTGAGDLVRYADGGVLTTIVGVGIPILIRPLPDGRLLSIGAQGDLRLIDRVP